MRTLEQIAASVSMDTNRFQSMLELYKTTPDFFGGDLAAALEEARQNESLLIPCLLYTSPSPRDGLLSRMPSSA